MAPREVSEKTLELNLCAEILGCIRALPGSQRAVWIGLTQAEEAREGLDARLRKTGRDRNRALMLQFKSPQPSARRNQLLYTFTINANQNRAMQPLAKLFPQAVFYVFPQYRKWQKVDRHAPCLAQDTWLLPVSCIDDVAFKGVASRAVNVGHGGQITPEWLLKDECGAVSLLDFCLDYSAGAVDLGMPAEALLTWLNRLQDTGVDPQPAELRFRRLNALFLPG